MKLVGFIGGRVGRFQVTKELIASNVSFLCVAQEERVFLGSAEVKTHQVQILPKRLLGHGPVERRKCANYFCVMRWPANSCLRWMGMNRRRRSYNASRCAGGHSWVATWLRGDRMVIDLAQFKGIGGLQFAIRNLHSQIFHRGS